MKQREFLDVLSVAEKLKCNTRHSDTSTGRRESVAEHSWRLALMGMEDNILLRWVDTLPEFQRNQFRELLTEMLALETPEAKLYKSLDKMEAVIQHNEADISSWLPLEYDLQLTYGAEEVKCAPYMVELKAQIDEWTREKIAAAGGKPEENITT